MGVEQIPHRDQPHYCRECGARFEKDPSKTPSFTTQTPHGAEYTHEIRAHHTHRDYVRCSRYCQQREQHEEVKAGRRLYGKGVDKILVDSTAYNKMFPDD